MFDSNRIKNFLRNLLGLIAFVAVSLPSLANLNSIKASKGYLDALTGSAALGLKAEGLIPLYLTANKAIYTDIQGGYDTESKGYSGEIGGGYRQILNKNLIIGGHLFVGATRGKALTNKRTALRGNIGLELYNKAGLLSVNGYFPLSKRKWSGGVKWGTEIGKSEQVMQGHSEYDTKYQLTDMLTKWGADLEVGHAIPIPKTNNNLKGYLGGYYYSQEKGDNDKYNKELGSIKGISTEISYQLSKNIKLEAEDTYDNYAHNAIMAGVELSIGGSRESSLQEELLNPVDHNLGSAETLGESNPITSSKIQLTNGSQTINGHSHLFEKVNHIYFFDASGSENADGSYENPYPYTDLTNAILLQIEQTNTDYSHIYITGTDPITVGELTIDSNQSLEGRYGGEKGYKAPVTLAQGEQMPTLKGSLILEGGSQAHPQEISGIRLYNENGNYITGIQVAGETNGASYIELNQMQLGENTQSTNANNYETGIEPGAIGLEGSLVITGSNINAVANGINVKAGENAGNVTVGEGTVLTGGEVGIENGGTLETVKVEGSIKGGEYGIENKVTIGSITGDASAQTSGTIEGGVSGIDNDLSGTIGHIEYLSVINGTGVASYGIENAGTLGGIINIGVIGSSGSVGIKNTGTIGSSSVNYGIDNLGTIQNIVGGTGTGSSGIIEGDKAGVYNSSVVEHIANDGTISGTGVNSYGIENAGTLGGITNTGVIGSSGSVGIKNTGTIGSSSVNYGIDNLGTIENIVGGTGTKSSGIIEGDKAGIYNSQTIGNIEYFSMIEGTSANDDSFGIRNTGSINDIIGGASTEAMGELKGSRAGISNNGHIGNIEYFSKIEAMFEDATEASYGILNSSSGIIGNIIGGTALHAGGEIEGYVYGINNQGSIGSVEFLSAIKGLSVTGSGIYNFKTIKEMINTGKINSGGNSGIINIGTIGSNDVTYGIENKSGGTISGISGEGVGTVEGYVAGINNQGTIANIQYFKMIEGMGTGINSYGILNTGEIGSVYLNILDGSSYGVYNEGGTISNWSDIVAGTAKNSYVGSGSKYGSSL